jgi:hypothetical protein
MSTYTVTQEGARFHVRLSDANGQIVATLSSKLAAELFAEKQIAEAKTQGTPKVTPKDDPV